MAELNHPCSAATSRAGRTPRARPARRLLSAAAAVFALACLAGYSPSGPAKSSASVGASTKQAQETSAVAKGNAAETSLVAAIKKAILAKGSVHAVSKGYQTGTEAAVETVGWDIGRTSATVSIAEGKAVVAIRVTPKVAYFSGNDSGLTKIAGLSSTQAKRVGSRWVEMKAGTSQYDGFAVSNTISSLPAAILPASTSSVKLASGTFEGERLNVLTWKMTPSGSSVQLTEELVVTATPQPLPVAETTTGGGDTRTDSFTNWGLHFTVPVPSPTSCIPYSRAVGG